MPASKDFLWRSWPNSTFAWGCSAKSRKISITSDSEISKILTAYFPYSLYSYRYRSARCLPLTTVFSFCIGLLFLPKHISSDLFDFNVNCLSSTAARDSTSPQDTSEIYVKSQEWLRYIYSLIMDHVVSNRIYS